MRLTTKIVTGIFASTLVLSLGVIICLSFVDMEKYSRQYTSLSISQDNIISVDIEPFHTICIDEIKIESGGLYPSGFLRLNPMTKEEDSNKLFLSEELMKFTDITSSNDTLTIRLKMDKINNDYLTDIEGWVGPVYRIDGINYFVNTNTVDIVCKYNGIKVDVRNITTDRIKIQTRGEVEIDSCRANLIEPIMSNSRRFQLKNSQVNAVNIDLDQTGRNWSIENCDIEVKNLTGSKKHNVTQPKSEAKIVNWIPKTKDAQLIVTLQSDTAQIVFP